MKFIKKAKSLDMFGKKINLNFDNEGEEYNSPQGIILSVMILTIVLLYTSVRSIVLAKNSDINVSSVSQPVNIQRDLGKVYLN